MVGLVPLYHLWSTVHVYFLIILPPITGSLQRQLYISKTWSVLRNIVFRPFYSPNVGADFMWRTMIKVTASQGGITWVCNSPSINRLSNGHFHNSHSLVSLQKPQKKSSCPGMKRRGTVIWRWMSFLMSREDPRTGSGGCRGAPCSRSGRRRWRDRRCTWAEDGCLSDSEGWERERERQVVMASNRPVRRRSLVYSSFWALSDGNGKGLPAVLELWYYWSATVCQFMSVVTSFCSGCVRNLRKVKKLAVVGKWLHVPC